MSNPWEEPIVLESSGAVIPVAAIKNASGNVVGLSAGGKPASQITTFVSPSDTTAEINAQLAISQNVHFTAGIYRTTDWLDIDVDDVHVTADYGQVTIKPADGADVGGFRMGFNAAVTNISIDAIGYDGNDLTMSPAVKKLHGIIVAQVDTFEITRCYLTRTHPYHEHNSGGSGITVEGTATNGTIENNTCYDIGDRGIQCAGNGVLIRGNRCIDGYDRGIALNVQNIGDSEVSLAKNTTIIGNLCRNSSEGSGIGVGPGTSSTVMTGQYTDNISVIGNVTEGNAHRGVRINGLRAEDGSVSVVGNTSRSDGLAGVSVDNVVSGHDGDVLIASNHIVAPAGPGVDIGANAVGVVVHGNVIRDPDSANNDPCVNIQAGADQIQISNNRLVGAVGGRGINVRGISVITGNTIVNCGSRGINVDAGLSIGTIIANNRVENCGAAPVGGNGNEGIWFASPLTCVGNTVIGSTGHGIRAHTAADESLIANNTVRGSTGRGINILADRCTVRDNALASNAGGGLIIDATADQTWITHDAVAHEAITDNGTKTVINGTASVAAGAATAPTAADYRVGTIVVNTSDSSVWLKSVAGTMVQVA